MTNSIGNILYPEYCETPIQIRDETSFKIACELLKAMAVELDIPFTCSYKYKKDSNMQGPKKFNPEIIEFALDLYTKKVPIRDIAAQIEEKYNRTISHTTIPHWAKKRGITRTTTIEKEGEK